MRALIADDDRMTAAMLRRSLERWGFEVVMAHDGQSAWEIIASDTPPSLAIVDWMMPELDGPEICRRVRGDARYQSLYLILLTGRTSRSDIVAGLDSGADDYLTKPFDVDELRARVQVGRRMVTLQERLTERVAELQDALAKVKKLRGLLPICSYCKRIRSDTDYWEQVESYISEHSEAQFSHGICPACFDKLEEELAADPATDPANPA